MYAKTAIFFGVNIREITTLKPETLNLKPDSGVNAFFDNKIRLISLSPITGERAQNDVYPEKKRIPPFLWAEKIETIASACETIDAVIFVKTGNV